MTDPTTAGVHPRVRTVMDALSRAGAGGAVRVLPDSARTAAQAAEALGVEVGAIVNSLVFEAFEPQAGEPDAQALPLLVLTSGAHRVDTAKLAADHSYARLRRATPEFVRQHTGQAIGGVSPVGHPAPITTLVDRWLSDHLEVWAAAGHPHAVFPTTYAELLDLTGGVPVDVA